MVFYNLKNASSTLCLNKYTFFLAALGLRCCAWTFSSCNEQGLFFIVVCGLSLRWLLLLQSMGSRRTGSVAVAHRP